MAALAQKSSDDIVPELREALSCLFSPDQLLDSNNYTMTTWLWWPMCFEAICYSVVMEDTRKEGFILISSCMSSCALLLPTTCRQHLSDSIFKHFFSLPSNFSVEGEKCLKASRLSQPQSGPPKGLTQRWGMWLHCRHSLLTYSTISQWAWTCFVQRGSMFCQLADWLSKLKVCSFACMNDLWPVSC